MHLGMSTVPAHKCLTCHTGDYSAVVLCVSNLMLLHLLSVLRGQDCMHAHCIALARPAMLSGWLLVRCIGEQDLLKAFL